MGLSLSQEVLNFINACDNDFYKNIYKNENIEIATKYIKVLENIKKTNDSNIVSALINKLKFIRAQINSMNNKKQSTENELNLIPLSVTDYIINLVKEKRVTDSLEIARYVYIELSKVLYYDISYVKQEDPEIKRIICNAPVDLKNEKIFSYVVCTQWLKLYSYILNEFGINVKLKNIKGQDHVWGEIELNDNEIVVLDATDYINASIDLSNSKSTSETVGFVVLPKKYTGIRLYNIFNNIDDIDTIKEVKKHYELNRELDMTLGYITDNLYQDEIIIQENDIFNYRKSLTIKSQELKKIIEQTNEFFNNLKIPTNMDGYEIYAYYEKFRKNLPKIISSNIAHDTIYVDSFFYKQNKMRDKFLNAPIEYLMYLEELVYKRYYNYISLKEGNYNELLERIKRGNIKSEELTQQILKRQMQIAEVNRNINYYYAIDKMQFYKPCTGEITEIKLYEPMMGQKSFNSIEKYKKFTKKLIIK